MKFLFTNRKTLVGLITWLALGLLPFSSLAREFNRVLIVGDSHMEGSFGRRLDADVRAQLPRARVHTLAVGGARPQWFLNHTDSPWGFYEKNFAGRESRGQRIRTPHIDELMARVRPNLVIVALGTNMMWNADHNLWDQTTSEFLQKIGPEYLWIAPPHMRPPHGEPIVDVFYLLSHMIPAYRLFNSARFTHYPEDIGDGIHYDRAGEPGFAQTDLWLENWSLFLKRFLERR